MRALAGGRGAPVRVKQCTSSSLPPSTHIPNQFANLTNTRPAAHREAGQWRMAMVVAARLGWDERQLQALAAELAEQLAAAGQRGDVAALLAEYLGDVDGAVLQLVQVSDERLAQVTTPVTGPLPMHVLCSARKVLAHGAAAAAEARPTQIKDPPPLPCTARCRASAGAKRCGWRTPTLAATSLTRWWCRARRARRQLWFQKQLSPPPSWLSTWRDCGR